MECTLHLRSHPVHWIPSLLNLAAFVHCGQNELRRRRDVNFKCTCQEFFKVIVRLWYTRILFSLREARFVFCALKQIYNSFLKFARYVNWPRRGRPRRVLSKQLIYLDVSDLNNKLQVAPSPTDGCDSAQFCPSSQYFILVVLQKQQLTFSVLLICKALETNTLHNIKSCREIIAYQLFIIRRLTLRNEVYPMSIIYQTYRYLIQSTPISEQQPCIDIRRESRCNVHFLQQPRRPRVTQWTCGHLARYPIPRHRTRYAP